MLKIVWDTVRIPYIFKRGKYLQYRRSTVKDEPNREDNPTKNEERRKIKDKKKLDSVTNCKYLLLHRQSKSKVARE